MKALLSLITLHFMVSYGVVKVNDQDGLSQNPPSGKTQTDLLLSSRLYEDERSLGLTGIKWVLNFLIEPFQFLLCFLPDY